MNPLRIYKAVRSISDILSSQNLSCDEQSSLVQEALAKNGIPSRIISITTPNKDQDLGHICGTPQYEHLVNLVNENFVSDPPWSHLLTLPKYLRRTYNPVKGTIIVAKDGDTVLAEYQHA